MANRAKIRKRAEQLKGRPVCVTLHDGRSYVGWISGFDKNGLTLSKQPRNRKSKKKSPHRSTKANVSGLMPLFGSLLGNMGGGGAGSSGAASPGAAGFGGFGGFGGLGSFIGMMQKTMPVMRMGYNMIKSISPLMNGIKGLMG
jgi:hypothetical protein